MMKKRIVTDRLQYVKKLAKAHNFYIGLVSHLEKEIEGGNEKDYCSIFNRLVEIQENIFEAHPTHKGDRFFARSDSSRTPYTVESFYSEKQNKLFNTYQEAIKENGIVRVVNTIGGYSTYENSIIIIKS